MDQTFACWIVSYKHSHSDSIVDFFLRFHSMLKQYGDWIKPLQYRLHLSTVECVIRLYYSFQAVIDSPHPQGSRSHGRIVFCIRFGDHPSFSAPLKITMPTLLFEPSPCPVFGHALLLVWDVTGFGVPSFLKLRPFFLLQIVISCYEPFTSLPFFRHTLRPEEQRVSRPQPDGGTVFNQPAMLASCAPCFSALWTLWGLQILGEYRFWVVAPRRGRLHGGATLSWSYFHTQKICFLLFNRYSLDTRESYDFSRLAHPWQTHRRQPPRMDRLITYFQTQSEPFNFFPFPATHWITNHFNFNKQWSLLELFCIHPFKGVTSLGRRTRPACN